MSKNNRAGQARLNGAKSKGPTSDTGKRWSAKNSFKTGLYAKTIAAFPQEMQDHYNQIHHAYREDYIPADSIEDDLVSQLAFNRARYHHFLKLLAQLLDQFPNPQLDHLERAISQLERSYIRTLNSLEDRRRRNPQLAAPDKIVIEWIDPRTGLPFRIGSGEKLEGTNPATSTNEALLAPEGPREYHQQGVEFQSPRDHAHAQRPFGEGGEVPVVFRGSDVAQSGTDRKHAGGHGRDRGKRIHARRGHNETRSPIKKKREIDQVQ